jgi:hypothetical protein
VATLDLAIERLAKVWFKHDKTMKICFKKKSAQTLISRVVFFISFFFIYKN